MRILNPKNVDITTKRVLLDTLFERLRNKEINLGTESKLAKGLWDNTKQSHFIESILIRIPLPAFYFDGTDDSNWLVVDGVQRLNTFQNYVVAQSFKLQNLEYLPELNSCWFGELPREIQRRLKEEYVIVYIISPGTPDDVKSSLIRRITNK